MFKKSIFYTEITRAECVKRLDSSVDKEQFFSFSQTASAKEFVGKLKGNKFQLYKNRPFEAACASVFYGQFYQQAQGTTIEGFFGLHPVAKFASKVWAIGVILLASNVYSAIIISRLTGKPFSLGGASTSVLGLAVMILLALMLIVTHRGLRVEDEKYINLFLQQTLEVKS